MKAITYTTYGAPDVLQLHDVEKSVPKENEILIKVQATTVNYGDLIARNFGNVSPSEFNMPGIFWLPARIEFGFSKPKRPILGSEFAGEVQAIGVNVTKFKVGDQVFGYLGQTMGAYAEYLCISEDGVVAPMPHNMSFAEAATIPYGSIMALHVLRKVNIQPGQNVLINGASGGIGSLAVQLAKHHFGANVTGVCSTAGMDYVKSLGADKVIDYTKEDFTASKETYDVVVDVLGRSSFSRCKKVLNANGRYLLVSFKTKQLLQMAWTSIVGNKKVICALSPEKQNDLIFIKELVAAGQIKSIIDKSYPLEQAAEAHRYVEKGQKKGNVVITL